MRLALIVIFGLIAISATYAWSNVSSQQAQANKVDQVSKFEQTKTVRKSITPRIAPQPDHMSNTAATTATTSVITQNAGSDTPSTAAPVVPVVIDGHATTLDAARITARSSTGKADPFTPLEQVYEENTAKKTAVKPPPFATGLTVPPPPPGTINPFGTHDQSRPGQLNSGLELGELPMPPDNAGINHKVELVGIIGDRAIFTIKDSVLRRRRHWPKTFTLALGQSFENLKLTAIKDESAVVEEDGQTFSKPMPTLK
jgi:archaellum component FlaG (FlaF/FlaG flagellin family)